MPPQVPPADYPGNPRDYIPPDPGPAAGAAPSQIGLNDLLQQALTQALTPAKMPQAQAPISKGEAFAAASCARKNST